MFTIDLNKMVKTEKVMIVIKRSIDIVNMKPPIRQLTESTPQSAAAERKAN
jgi:hypothetical protein